MFQSQTSPSIYPFILFVYLSFRFHFFLTHTCKYVSISFFYFVCSKPKLLFLAISVITMSISVFVDNVFSSLSQTHMPIYFNLFLLSCMLQSKTSLSILILYFIFLCQSLFLLPVCFFSLSQSHMLICFFLLHPSSENYLLSVFPISLTFLY